MDVILTTNGQLLTSELARTCCDAGLTHILFSIDAATSTTYEQIRVGGRFEKVLVGIDYIREWKKVHGCELPIIRASFVLNRVNAHEQVLFVERFKPLVDYIDIQTFFSVDGLNRDLRPSGHQRVTPDAFCCTEPFRKLIIRADGDVAPCCTVFGYHQIMGNAGTTSLRDIFNSPEMKNLRTQLKTRQFNGICYQCLQNVYVTDPISGVVI